MSQFLKGYLPQASRTSCLLLPAGSSQSGVDRGRRNGRYSKNPCDLITVAQALYWFDTDTLFDSVQPGGFLTPRCYAAHQINDSIDVVVEKLAARASPS